MNRRISTAVLVLLALAGGALAADLPSSAGLTQQQIANDVLSAMDRSVDPCQDFYRYACGGWLATAKMPGDRSRWTRSFSVIDEENREFLRTALEDAAKNPGTDADRRRVGDFYAACMDDKAVEKAGIAPLKPFLERIATVKDAKSAMTVAGEMQRDGSGAFLRLGPLADFKRPDFEILFMIQGGLGMPDRDYYLSEDAKKKDIRAAYEKHVATMLGLIGEKPEDARRHAAAVLAFETELAKVSRDRTAMRDVEKLYHKVDRSGLEKMTPSLAWEPFFQAVGLPKVKDISVATPEFFEGLQKLLPATPAETLQAYLRWHLVHDAADALSDPFVEANFDFYGKTLSGTKEIQPRWKRCVRATEEALGESLGAVYVAAKFPGDSKKIALEMIGDIEQAFSENLPNLKWMDEPTRKLALEKKAAVVNKIGYPDKWRDYSKLQIGRQSYFANALAAARFETARELNKVEKPVDRTEWGMTPQTVNAYYNGLQNEIVFPAGILQPPFFYRDYPAVMNYGAIGTVIGHELTHGFDDQGRKFDPKGEQREWWSKDSSEKFEKQAQCIADQYSGYEIEKGVKVNGKLTLGENIADNGGLKESWNAYKAWEKRHGGPSPSIDGLTPDQLFFIAHAQAWCTLITPEAARLQVTVDPHSPSQFRVFGPIANHPAFGEAFHCPAGAPMNPADKCVVW